MPKNSFRIDHFLPFYDKYKLETKELENDFELSKNVFEIEMMSTVWY